MSDHIPILPNSGSAYGGEFGDNNNNSHNSHNTHGGNAASAAGVAKSNGQLSTSSPAGIAAASAVTPDKLANLLLTQGPLAIRHLTSHLANLIPGFAQLSLSKQRRLIIAALDSGDPVTGCIFEKVGWGQWAAKKVGTDYVKAMQAQMAANGTLPSYEDAHVAQPIHTQQQQQQPPVSAVNGGVHSSAGAGNGNVVGAGTGGLPGSTGSITGAIQHTKILPSMPPAAAGIASPIKKPSEAFGWKNRRESITTNNDIHTDFMPKSPRFSSSVVNMKKKSNIEDAIASSSDDEDYDENAISDGDDEDDVDGLSRFQYLDSKPLSVHITQPVRSHSLAANTANTNAPGNKSRRSSFNASKGIMKPKVRSRLSSFNNDFYEPNELQEDLNKSRRRQSFNESFIRKSSSPRRRLSISNLTNDRNVPIKSSSARSRNDNSDTDEEDWKSMGAASLSKDISNSSNTSDGSHGSNSSRPSLTENDIKIKSKNFDNREEAAAYALVNLATT